MYKISWKSIGEKNSKIGLKLPELWSKVKGRDSVWATSQWVGAVSHLSCAIDAPCLYSDQTCNDNEGHKSQWRENVN